MAYLGCRIAEKRPEGGEAQIPASDAVMPLALERIEKRQNLRSVEITEGISPELWVPNVLTRLLESEARNDGTTRI
jgi:hypothetical protein